MIFHDMPIFLKSLGRSSFLNMPTVLAASRWAAENNMLRTLPAYHDETCYLHPEWMQLYFTKWASSLTFRHIFHTFPKIVAESSLKFWQVLLPQLSSLQIWNLMVTCQKCLEFCWIHLFSSLPGINDTNSMWHGWKNRKHQINKSNPSKCFGSKGSACAVTEHPTVSHSLSNLLNRTACNITVHSVWHCTQYQTVSCCRVDVC